jgi:hypothetical protein
MAAIRIAIDTNAIEIRRFLEYSRSAAGAGNTTYSLVGTPIDTGLQHEPKMVWEIAAIVSEETKNMLELIYAISDQRRRTLQNYSVVLHDTISPIVEAAPTNTRAIVPTHSAEAVGLGGLSYYAQFYGGFAAKPQIKPYGTGVCEVRFSIVEHEKFTP